MKKLITLTMVLALSVAFTAGCKKKEEAAPAPAVEAPAAEAPAPEAKPVQAPMSATAGAPAEAPKH